LADHLSSAELQQRYRTCSDAKEARRWHTLWLLSTGLPISAVARTLGFHRNWVRTIAQRYNAEGPSAVCDRHRLRPGGAPARLNAEQRQRLSLALQSPPEDGGLWTGPKVAAWIERQTGVKTYPQLGWVYLRQLGLSLRVPRPQHADAATPEQQQAWKKN
jgi:transposase